MSDKFSKAERSRIMAKVKSRNTAPEMVVRRLVHSMRYRYRLHAKNLPGTPDLAFPSRRKVVNVHGCFGTCIRAGVPNTVVATSLLDCQEAT